MNYIKNIVIESKDNKVSDLTKELMAIWPQNSDNNFVDKEINSVKYDNVDKYEYFQEPLSKRKRNYS